MTTETSTGRSPTLGADKMGHGKNSQCLVTYMHFLQRIDGESSNEPNILGFFFFLGGLGRSLFILMFDLVTT